MAIAPYCRGVLTHLLTGMLTGWSLIIAVGPQNAFVLRQGIRREHVGVVVAICTAADALLMVLGTAGIGAVVDRAPIVLDGLRWGGAAYLLWFACTSFRSARRPESLHTGRGSARLRSAVLTALVLTFLNPAVYIDTMLLVGSLANQLGEDRWTFTAGAILGSATWFAALGFGSRALAPFAARPRVWQIVDIAVGIVMIFIALRLLFGA
jgi:L-lysine exporter family protein LysE/ArgO